MTHVSRALTRLHAARGHTANARSIAARLQADNPAWCIIWSPWRQTFTAFAGFTTEPVVLDEPSPRQLLAEMRQVEIEHLGNIPLRGRSR